MTPRPAGRTVVTALALAMTALTSIVACGSEDDSAQPSPPASSTPSESSSASPSPTPTPSPTRSPTPSPTPTAVPTESQAAPFPAYAPQALPIDAALAARMTASWRPGCPVPLEDLRYLSVPYVDFDGVPQRGELVVHADAVDATVAAFGTLYEQRFPIRSMRLVDDFSGDDDASMAADNTSAFNCRAVTGGSGWSRHAYGRAIDVNPIENPYVRGRTVLPPAGRDSLDRSPARPGMAEAGAVDAFAAVGWAWGGNFSAGPDYQHFSADGR